ncbi:MAG TPA: hypothetical protein ENK18_05345 [Deltaproteobacteria bacterium]|nr:hypothetical protein [Deltaproteobacteria bacterium]
MNECPFCGSEVSEELVAYGGTCPKCFAEIPGEEAATDPGEEVRAAQEQSDRRRVASRAAVVGLVGMLSLVVCTGAIALAFVLTPEPEIAALIDFDELDFPLPEVVGIQGEPAAVAVAPRPDRPRPSTPTPSTRPAPVAPAAPSGAERFARDGAASAAPPTPARDLLGAPEPERVALTGPRPRGPGAPSGPARSSTGGGSSRAVSIDLSGGDVKVARDSNIVLDDALAIRNMIGEKMRAGIPELVNCYNRRLKQIPGLRGRWRLTFTVTPEGRASGAKATPLDRGDAELEICLASHVEREWSFGKIAVASPVAKTLTFKAQGS